jgi:hypothetical protein
VGVPGAPAEWVIYKQQPGLVLGFHGCDRQTAEEIFAGRSQHLHKSTNEYDWLGSGIYFWECDPWRALHFATEAKSKRHLTNGSIMTPWVVGAVIDLGLCLNLMEIAALEEVRSAWRYLKLLEEVVPGNRMPLNTGQELGARFLDKAVIETVHSMRKRRRLRPYDAVRSVFHEGSQVYPSAGFRDRNHIQIAVKNPDCIKGYFRLPGY